MHQEVLKPRVISAATNYCLLVAIALMALIVAPLLHNRVLPNIQYAIYAGIALAAFVVAKWQVTEFRYCIIINELIFDRNVLKKNKKLAVVDLGKILAFGRYRELKNKAEKTFVYTMKPKKSAYALFTEMEGRTVRIVFHPSEKMVRCIEHRIACERDQATEACA